MTLTVQEPKEVSVPFQWRDKKGEFHSVTGMRTGHLFYVVRMIWNHKMPLKFEPYRRYSFSSFYTDEYMFDAIKAIVPELAKRTDLAPEWKQTIKQMVEYLARYQLPSEKLRLIN